MSVEDVVKLANSEIESHGWAVKVSKSDTLLDSQTHIELTKNNERRAWGFFPDVHCWSQAYKAITGKDILSLKTATK